jgi:hypothetical protein
MSTWRYALVTSLYGTELVAAWRAGKIRRIEEWGKPRPMSPAERARFITQMAEVRTKVPAAKPFAFDTRHRIDSFLVGKELS